MQTTPLFTRNVVTLFACQVVNVGGTVLMVTVGGIMGASMAPHGAMATLPLALMVVGTAVSTIGASAVMARIGRRRGFSIASMIGLMAASCAALAASQGSFLLLCAANLLLGTKIAFSAQYRFAAAESVSAHRGGQAVSVVLSGALGGAFLGPALALQAQDLLASGAFVGSFVVLATLYLVELAMLSALTPTAAEREHRGGAVGRPTARPLSEIARQSTFRVAVLAGIVGQGTMVFIMTATPISMHVMNGHSLADTTGVVQAHVIAMYGPALLTGLIVARLGAPIMMTIGALVTGATIVVGLSGTAVPHYWISMALLGIGWNFLYIGGTTQLLTTYRPAERFKSQALNDFSVYTASAIASLLAGSVVYYLGWNTVLILCVPVVAAMLLTVFMTRNEVSHAEASG
ncbi:MAG: MFS transporter [Gammaproteobacteria bacterium]|nr:MFS transporter [Gammaproteobacteria bacterium]